MGSQNFDSIKPLSEEEEKHVVGGGPQAAAAAQCAPILQEVADLKAKIAYEQGTPNGVNPNLIQRYEALLAQYQQCLSSALSQS